MNLDQLCKKLIALARLHPPSDHVPYAFEQRVMARLAALPVFDPWTLWGRGLWRAAAPCVAIMCVTLVWSALSSEAGLDEPLATALDNTVMGPLAQLHETW
jgi:hypothetical protein